MGGSTALLVGVAVAGFVVSLPNWLPSLIIAARQRIFTRLNGAEGIPIPGATVNVNHFKQIYSDPAADGRSRGAGLSDLFWYWLSPGAHLHQEHLEPGERYREVAHATRRILAQHHPNAERIAARCAARCLDEQDITSARLVRLRDLMMPVWAEFYYELVFGEPCTPLARKLIVDNADDVVTALKCCGPRHMGRRGRLTGYLVDKLERDGVPHQLPESLTVEERALYLQGTYFTTAVVQSSEAMAHLLLALAHHQDVQARLAAEPDDDGYLGRVVDEALRMYPLFGIAHRITSAEITVAGNMLPAGSVLLFNYPDYHRSGYADPDRFDPDRWETLSHRDAAFIPFGVPANRPCPAQGLAPATMRGAVREMLHRYALHSSAAHTRSIPNRGPCLLVPRSTRLPVTKRRALLAFMRVRDRAEDVWRSVVQLVLGSYMVWHARRLRLCQRYFEEHQQQEVRPT
jgi:Cytochrome P450